MPENISISKHINEDLNALENFVVNNPELEELERLIGEFNIFEALGAVYQEVRHSNFLAFLLNPRENHGLGDRFLKQFLKTALYGQTNLEVTAIDIEVMNFDNALVRREWEGMDIIIEDGVNQLVVVIENKIRTTEHSRQLQRYRERVENHFPVFRKLFIYLTPEGDLPSDEHYIPLDYERVVQTISGFLETSRSILGREVSLLMQHYVTMLRRHIVTDPRIIELCQKIYAQHQRALDLIFEHRPDLQFELSNFFLNLIKESSEAHNLVLDYASKIYIRFGLAEWDNFPELKMGEGWTKSGRILLFEIRIDKNAVNFWLEVGPGPQKIRETIHQFALQHPKIFKAANKKIHTKWTFVYRHFILKQRDFESLDGEELKEKIKNFWERFLNDELPPIREKLNQLFQSSFKRNH